MRLPSRVTIREVGPRDGFQYEQQFIPTEEKVAIIDAIAAAGVPRIEASSFISPRAIPQMRDAAEVFARLPRRPGVSYEALVPNAAGARRAVAAGVDKILIVIAASDVANRANVNMTVRQSLVQAEEIMAIANAANVPVLGAIATTTGCAYTGEVPLERVLWLAEEYVRLGVGELYVADSLGMGFPTQVARIAGAVRDRWPEIPLVQHLHDTRGMGLANALAALEAGVTTLDASIAGLGGCPFAPGSSGNVCTDDLVHMLHGMGIETGVDLDALLAVARHAEQVVGHRLPGAVMHAGKSHQTIPIPPQLLAPEGVKTVQDVAGLSYKPGWQSH